MKNIKEFEVYVPQSKIDLLHEKIALSRWPDELNDNKWSLGTSLDYLKKLRMLGLMILVGEIMSFNQ